MDTTLHDKEPLLEVSNFSLSFRKYEKNLEETSLEVIRKLDMTIHKGEIVAVVGASGSGKSLLANAILGILPKHATCSGTLTYKGKILTKELQEKIRGKEIAIIPQPVNALNPLMKVGNQIQIGIQQENKKRIQHQLFQKLGLSVDTGEKYPFELSGGMTRRVLITSAMMSATDLVVADEPTPGLDPDTLYETFMLLKKAAQNGKGIMLITHDIETALKIADKVVVFHKGETIETAKTSAFSGKGEKLKHPYTKALWNALPSNQFISVRSPASSQKVEDNGGLEVKGLSYKYEKGPYLFKDLSIFINPGEIVGLYGHSGSGKTTMAKIVAGYLKPKQGIVKINGKTDFKKGIFPVQLIWQHPEMTINPRWRMKKVLSESGLLRDDLLEEFGIQEEWLFRWPSELSGGELQRFCIVRALTNETEFLIADEMTTMLDAVTQAKLWDVILRIAKEKNIGVLAISHHHQLLQRISDRIINFHDIRNV